MSLKKEKKTVQTSKFHVKGNETLGLGKIVKRINSTVVLKTTEATTTIECAKSVFYPIRVCYLLSQEGDILFSKDYDALADGNCYFEVFAGEWTCGFNGPNAGDEDFVQNFAVIRYGKVYSGSAATIADDGCVRMECHLFQKNSIKVCMFVSPS